MASLLSGLAGSSWSRSSGLAASSQIARGDVESQDIKRARGFSAIGPRIGKFRRAIDGVTKDATGAPLGAVTVHAFRTSDDVEVDQVTSDAGGMYCVCVYTAGPFYCKAEKAGAPNVAGATDNTLTGV